MEIKQEVRRGRGRPRRAEQRLTSEQRAALGTDRWFRVPQIAAILGITEETLRDAITGGRLTHHRRDHPGRAEVFVNGLDVIRWRDKLAGISDGDEPPR